MTVRARSPDGAQRNPGSLIRIVIPGFRLRFIRATGVANQMDCEKGIVAVAAVQSPLHIPALVSHT
jgi:hypothetical protein